MGIGVVVGSVAGNTITETLHANHAAANRCYHQQLCTIGPYE
mgnify:CR=1 FL=1